LVGRTLYIAMAGPHQIWQFDLEKQQVSTFAGSGREARRDGPLLDAGFAQPSGITSDGKSLFIADSESNIIRKIDPLTGRVVTLVGGDLFEFGDEDGTGNDVRLQHPLGVVSLSDRVLIADTYNHKIKELDPENLTVKSFAGTGKPGQVDGKAPSFYEPGGLSIAGGKLFVADTNNHAIRVVDLKSKQTTTLKINGLQPPAINEAAEAAGDGPNAEEMKVPSQRLRLNNEGLLLVNVDLPSGYHLNPSAPQRYRVSIESGPEKLALHPGPSDEKTISGSTKDLKFPLRIPLRSIKTGATELRVQMTLFYCREDNTGTCHIKTLVWRAPVEVVEDAAAPTEINLRGKVSAE
jgi:hypothetical protein